MDPIEAQRRKLEERLQKKRKREAEETGQHAVASRTNRQDPEVDDDEIEDLDDSDFESDDALEDASLEDLDDLDLDDDDDVGDLDSDIGDLDAADDEMVRPLPVPSDEGVLDLDSDLHVIEELSDDDFASDEPAPPPALQPDGVDFSKIASAIPGLEDELEDDLEELDDPAASVSCPRCAQTSEANARLVDTLGQLLLDLLRSDAEPTAEQRAVIAALETLRS